MTLTRRLTLCAAAAAVAALSLPAWAQNKIKVAAIYTVPVEQQWVSPHRQGAEGGGRARRDRVRVLRERRQRRLRARDARVCREGQHADRRRIVRGRGRGAQGGQGLPEGQLPDGQLGQAAGAELRRLRQLHPGAGLPERHDRRRHDQDQQDRHGRRLPDPRGQPADERLHGRREGNQPEGRVHGHLHQQLVRPAQGQGSRLRDDRQGRRRDVRRALRRQRRGQGKGQARHRQRHQHAGQVPRHRGRLGAVEHGADDRPGAEGGQGRQVQGRGLWASTRR